MKNIIILALLLSTSLLSIENVQTNKSGSFSSATIDGEAFYKKRCSVCHGEKGKKASLKSMIPLAGMDAGVLARKVRAYRDQEDRVGAYAIYETSMVMREATYSISNAQISAIAVYLSGLK